MKKSTRKGGIFPAAGCRFVVNCSLLGMRPLRIEMNSPFTFTPTTTSTTYTSRQGEVNAENNSVHMKNLPFRVGDFLFLFSSIQAYKYENSVRVIWQILQNWLPSLRSVGQMSTTDVDYKRLTLQINLLEIKISSLELSFLTWHNFGTFVQLSTDQPCISITEQ